MVIGASILAIWQHLPSHITPVIFTVAGFSLRWYSLMYLVALGIVYLLSAWRIRRKEITVPADEASLQTVVFASVVGILLGGRLGYVLIYDLSYFIRHPMEILLPFSFSGGIHYTGFSGLSFHGGLIGVLLVFAYLSWRRRWAFLDLTDALAPAIPLAYTFGRIGNFINGELYGRVTDLRVGMVFPMDPYQRLRFPSQLFEAALEGLALFAVLWLLRNRRPFKGFLSGVYLMGYGVARFFVEFTREPDPQLGFVLGPLSMGQVLCLFMIAAALVLWANQWYLASRQKVLKNRL